MNGRPGRAPSRLLRSNHLIWVWLIYQSVKGTLTLLLIWIPLALLWFQR